jgi:hypothetical protein
MMDVVDNMDKSMEDRRVIGGLGGWEIWLVGPKLEGAAVVRAVPEMKTFDDVGGFIDPLVMV